MSQHVLLVTVDSLRADRADPDAGLMPTLGRLADRGVRYDQAFSNGYATPTAFPAILTGTQADQYGGYRYMSDERPFLARHLRERGYRTAAFHSNPHLRTEHNYHVGFDDYADFESTTDTGSSLRHLVTSTLPSDSRLYALLRRAYHYLRERSRSADYLTAPEINDRALDWLDDSWDGDAPFFLWNHYMDVHYPFYPPDEYVRPPGGGDVSTSRKLTLNGRMQENPEALSEADVADLIALYEGEIRYMDDHLGRLLDALDRRGLLDDTLVVVTSDHGELFGEYGEWGHPPLLHDESVHVPLVLAGPGVPAGATVREQTTLVDLPPTLASLLGVDRHPEWVGTDTTRFFSTDATDAVESRAVVLGNHTVVGCQTADWRLVEWIDAEDRFDDREGWELWDRRTGERVSLDDHTDVVDRLRGPLSSYRETIRESDQSLPAVETDDEVQRRLEALGYR